MSNILEIKNLTIHYVTDDEVVKAVNDISITLEAVSYTHLDVYKRQGTEGSKTFTGQSKVRSVLGNTRLVFNRKDGSTYTEWETLPSGFIYIENQGTDENGVTAFTIYGGGYGHGAGMSQNCLLYTSRCV